LIADVMLPGKSGLAIAAEISQFRVRLPFLFISGTPMRAWPVAESAIFRNFPSEAVEFLEKPFLPVDLLAAVANLCGPASPQEAGDPYGGPWSELNEAARAYHSAKAEWKAILERAQDLPFGQADGNFERRRAAHMESAALARYRSALRDATAHLRRERSGSDRELHH
jgi:CheY-like chemotaxis protein